MATLNRDGFEIYYETHGRGPAVLLSHGFGASSAMWQPSCCWMHVRVIMKSSENCSAIKT